MAAADTQITGRDRTRPGEHRITRSSLGSTPREPPTLNFSSRTGSRPSPGRCASSTSTRSASPRGCVLREESMADAHPCRVTRGHLPVDVRDDRPEPPGGVPAGQGRPRLRGGGTGAEAQHDANARDPRTYARGSRPRHRRSVAGSRLLSGPDSSGRAEERAEWAEADAELAID